MVPEGMILRALPLLLTASLALAGCKIIPAARTGAPPNSPPPQLPGAAPPDAKLESPLTFAALGQTVSLNGPQVTPRKVLEDSRCPANARCVWAGQVRLRVRVNTGARHHDLDMTSGKAVRVADGMLELVEVRPDKFTSENNGAVEPSAYRFGFRFSGGV